VSEVDVKPTFAKASAFHAELRRRVHAHLAARGLPTHGGARIIVKAGAVLAAFAASYVALVAFARTPWQVALAAFALSQSVLLIGFTVMHDAGHGSFSDRPWLNRIMGHGLDLVGGSQLLWRYKHGVLHHTYPNVASLDDDLDAGGALRLHPAQPWRPHHRYQVLYAPLLYSLLLLSWALIDIRQFVTRRMGPHRLPRPRAGEAAVFFGLKLLYVSLALVIPALLHPLPVVVAVYLAVVLTVGLTASVVFQLAHVVEEAAFPERPADARFADDWAVHQLRTTVDFSVGHGLVSAYTGGLNHQVIHHLFPRISHVRYPEIQPVIAATCAEFGVPYRVNRTLLDALRSHLRVLRRLAAPPLAAAASGGPSTPPAS
jgi:linoleoyl-CoA desaturase